MRISKNPEIRRQEIIDTARELYEVNGITKTSITQIADKIGVAKGLVYYYFSSKEQLTEAIIKQFLEQLDVVLEEIIRQNDMTFHEKLAAILFLYFKSFQNNPGFLNFPPVDPDLFSLLRKRASETALNHATTLLHQGMEQNLIRIEYPEYTLKVLIRGLGDLYLSGVSQVHVHASLIEQALGLEKGSLKLKFD